MTASDYAEKKIKREPFSFPSFLMGLRAEENNKRGAICLLGQLLELGKKR